MKHWFSLLFSVLCLVGTAQPDSDSSSAFNFAVVDKLPVFPGCPIDGSNEERMNCMNTSMMSFIATNFKYPEEARKKKIQGRIFVNFVIETDGSISNVTIARGAHPLLDNEAVRVIKAMPDFIAPAYQRGKPVRMQYTVPINAKLE